MFKIREPHTVSLTRPVLITDEDTNESVLDYSENDPRDLCCNFQQLSVAQLLERDGVVIEITARIFTTDLDVLERDRIEFSGGTFTVSSVVEHRDFKGTYNHTTCDLARAQQLE